MSQQILVLEDDESLRLVMTRALARAGYDVRATASIKTVEDRLFKDEVDLLVADVVLGQDNFLDHIETLRTQYPQLPIIVVSAQTTAQTAINSAVKGATEYLPKPFDLDDLIRTVEKALGSETKPTGSSQPPKGQGGLIGQSRAMQPVFKAIGNLSRNEGPVLITGREGTGRALIARTLHAARGKTKLVEAGPARLSDDGSAVFNQSADGLLLRRFERWDDRTRDRVLEYLEQDNRACVYVTAQSMITDPSWSSLTLGLSQNLISVPRLKERGEDILVLFETFLKNLTSSPPELGKEAQKFLLGWNWPGEVPELKALAGRLVQENLPGPITLKDLRPLMTASPSKTSDTGWASHLDQKIQKILSDHSGSAAQKLHDEIDRHLISAALAAHAGIRKDAAECLGWNRNTLARRMKSLNMTGQDED